MQCMLVTCCISDCGRKAVATVNNIVLAIAVSVAFARAYMCSGKNAETTLDGLSCQPKQASHLYYSYGAAAQGSQCRSWSQAMHLRMHWSAN